MQNGFLWLLSFYTNVYETVLCLLLGQQMAGMEFNDNVWSELRIKGNSLYMTLRYAEAIESYSRAIDILEEKALYQSLSKPHRLELAKIYSNRSAALFQLNCDKPGSSFVT